MTKSKGFLPNKSVGVMLVVIFGVIIFGALIIRNNNLSKEVLDSDIDPSRIVTEKQQENLEDTDGDGLKNWEEGLWKTDPENPDTDEDGISDGEEVDSGKSPVVPGPDDELYLVSLQNNSSSTTPLASSTQTELFSQAFITMYLNSAFVGDSFNNQAESLASIAVSTPPPTINYSVENLLILEKDMDEQLAHVYGNNIGNVLENNEPGVENELIIILQAIRDNDPEHLKKILKTSKAYESNATDLMSVPVPQDVAQQHLRLVNAFSLVGRDIQIMSFFFEDPLRAVSGFDSYFESAAELISALNDIGRELDARTSFFESESGYMFTSNL